MAVYFGDELKSSNSKYPLIDLSANSSKGVIFVDALSELKDNTSIHPDFVNKAVKGAVVVHRTAGKAYIFTATDDPVVAAKFIDLANNGAASAHWNVLGDVPVFSDDITVSEGQFGKYSAGEVVPFNGLTALEAIENALIAYQQFESGDVIFNSTYAAEYDFSVNARDNQSVDVTFKIRNTNRPAIIGAANTAPVKNGIYRIDVIRSFNNSNTEVGHVAYNYTSNAWVAYSDVGGTYTADTGVFSTVTDLATKMNTLNSRNSSPTTQVSFTFTDDDLDIPADFAENGDERALYKIKVYAIGDGDDYTEVYQSTGAEAAPDTVDSGSDTSTGLYIESAVTVSPSTSAASSGVVLVNGYEDPIVEVHEISDWSASASFGAVPENAYTRVPGNVDSHVRFVILKPDETSEIERVTIKRAIAKGRVLSESGVSEGFSGNYVTVFDTDTANDSLATDQNNSGNWNGATDTYTLSSTNPEYYGYGEYVFEEPALNTASGAVTGDSIAESDAAIIHQLLYKIDVYTDVKGNSSDSTSSVYVNFNTPTFIGYGTIPPTGATAVQISGAIESSLSGTEQRAFTDAAKTTNWVFFNTSAQGDETSDQGRFADAFNDNDAYTDTSTNLDGLYTYLCIPHRYVDDSTVNYHEPDQLTSILNLPSETVLGDFGGPGGRYPDVDLEFENGATYPYLVYVNSTPGTFYDAEFDFTA